MAIASDKTKEYLQMLEEKFNTNNFYEFIKDLLNLENENIINGQKQKATSEQYKNYIDTTQLFAEYEDNKRRKIGVLIIKLQDNKLPANARTMQRNYIAHLLDAYNLDASLSAIYSNTDDTWRLSFVKQEIEFSEGKLKSKFTPAKRYSYLFGKDEPNHTAKEQLLELLENNNKQYSIEEIEEKFSVEKVTKDFFENYKENYLKLKETLEGNEEFVSEAKRCDFTSEEFTKKLMGQIVFIYFLQKKGWLGVKLVPQVINVKDFEDIYKNSDVIQKKILDKYYITFNNTKKIKKELLERYNENKQEIENLSDIFVNTKFDCKWGTGEKRFIRKIFENCVNRNKNFFDNYLEPFFYDALNNKRKNQYFSLFNCKIPFLNGGLFEPLDNYQWQIAKFNIDNEIFSNKEKTGILDFFDRYNFTMDEEEPLEKDVAVDPEMLGKIFENLLDVKDRKSKGAFYTPREIVHYMCQESIANFLVNKVGVDYNEIKEFIQYGEMIRDIDMKEATKESYLVGKTVFKNIVKIDNALEHIKIADPAVGSGAFPLGILNEIVKLRDILTSYMLIYNRLGLFGKKYPEEKITNYKRSIYQLKWNTIKNSIYAVDIENSAVDITKLRLWLSIVVDQTDDPEPLPNLNCKIMQGNSLIDEYAGIKLIDKKFIDELKDRQNVKFNDGGKIKSGKRMIEVVSNQIQFGDGQKKAQIDDLISLKQELYGENDPERKKILLEKIQTARNELLKLNFIGTNKEKELFEIDKSHNKPYFAWMLEFIEVYIENDGFDIVIGNPPYLGIQGIIKASPQCEKIYKNNFYSATGYYDLYVLFVENGIKKMINSTGILNFIMPHSWIVAEFGKGLRKMITNSYHFKKFITFGAYKVFNASTYTSLVWFDKNKEKTECLYYEVTKDLENNRQIEEELRKIDESNLECIDMSTFNDSPWVFANKFSLNIMNKLSSKGKIVKDCFKGVFKGITSGDNKAFCFKKIEEDDDYYICYSDIFQANIKLEKKLIKPLYIGDSFKRYNNIPTDNLILYPYKKVENKTVIYEEDELKEIVPLTYKYLISIKERLSNRGTEKMKYPRWYSLWNFRKIENFENEKILTPDVCHNTSMIIDKENIYYNDMCYAMIEKDDISYSYEYLIGILNSKLFWFYLNNVGTVLSGGFFRFKTKYIENFKIIFTEDKSIIEKIEGNVKMAMRNSEKEQYEKNINELVYELYGLTEKEIKYIEENY